LVSSNIDHFFAKPALFPTLLFKDVPLKCEGNISLGSFVNNQRTEYRKFCKGEPSSMTNEKIKDLEDLGFRWSVRESRTPWMKRLKELQVFKKEFGHVNVPKNWKGNPTLSYWVQKQRQVSLGCQSFPHFHSLLRPAHF
jgi:hypothetical protein